jgi:hypothetical protein
MQARGSLLVATSRFAPLAAADQGMLNLSRPASSAPPPIGSEPSPKGSFRRKRIAAPIVIGHCDGKRDLDIRAYGGQAKTADKRIIGIVIGAQEAAPF